MSDPTETVYAAEPTPSPEPYVPEPVENDDLAAKRREDTEFDIDAEVADANARIADLKNQKAEITAERDETVNDAIEASRAKLQDINAKLAEQLARIPKVWTHPEAPAHSDDAEQQKQRNLKGIAGSVEDRLARLEARLPPEDKDTPDDSRAGDAAGSAVH
jgi:seryl-tRNA synthetase